MSLEAIANWLGYVAVQNTITTTLMAAAVWLLCRAYARNPAVRNLLWLLVLIKFVLPPVPGLAWRLPAAAPQVVPPSAALPASPGLSDPEIVAVDSFALAEDVSPPMAAETVRHDSRRLASYLSPTLAWRALAGLWLAGATAIVARGLARSVHRYRIVRRGAVATNPLAGIVDRVARQLRLRTLMTRLVSGIDSPFLCCLGRVQLAWPQQMADLPESNIRAVVAHEVAHVRRGDHWVAWIELFAAALWWWNPVFWSVRRQLHCTAEMSCDAMALETFPEDRCSYAEMLLWLSASSKTGAPPLFLAVGGGAPSSLERRMSMIVSDRVSGKLSWSSLLAAGLLAASAAPSWSLAYEATEDDVRVVEPSPRDEGEPKKDDVRVIPPTQAQDAAADDVGSGFGASGGGGGNDSGGGSTREPGPADESSGTRSTDVRQLHKEEVRAMFRNMELRKAHGLPEATLLRLKAMYFTALADGRTEDAESLRATLAALGAPLEERRATRSRLAERTKRFLAGESTSKYFPAAVRDELALQQLVKQFPAVRRTVTGSKDGEYYVWAKDRYRFDSSVHAAAVDAGLVKPGESADVVLSFGDPMASGDGGEGDESTAQDAGRHPPTYRLLPASEHPQAPYLGDRSALRGNAEAYLTLNMLSGQAPLKAGTVILVPLHGNPDGPVRGDATYSSDSSLDAAAVHSGALKPKQFGFVKLILAPGQDSYTGTFANGVASSASGKSRLSFRIEPVTAVIRSYQGATGAGAAGGVRNYSSSK